MDLRVGNIFKSRVREGCLRSWQQRGSGGGGVLEPALCPSRKRALYSLHRGTMAQRVHRVRLSSGQSCRAHVSNDLEQ